MDNVVFARRYSDRPEIIERSDSDKGSRIILKSNYPSGFSENGDLPLYLYKGGRKGTVLFFHGRGEKNLDYLRWFPENLAKTGYAGAMMILPYHFERTPIGYRSGELFLDPRTDVLRERFENAVVDGLTCLNYLKWECPPPYFLMGYSFGGFISVITAALDRSICALSLVVTGGNFYHITWKSFVTGVMRVKYEEDGSCNKEKCKKLHGEDYERYIRSLEGPELEIGSAPISCFEYDPLTFAKFVKCPTLINGALFDIFVPRRSTKELSERIPNSTLRWMPTGHLTSILLKRTILKRSIDFFEGKCKGKNVL
ncbi:alpha/beta hydrolase family protein [Mesotoga sp.]|uniref:alpha/beta hydrolase family protein n=1 Tax=Mesotoga sp. TaxID=2053577 RepID=UPI001BD2028F|nr:alpha/beta hydrolase family protein [Mesotoga sp.]